MKSFIAMTNKDIAKTMFFLGVPVKVMSKKHTLYQYVQIACVSCNNSTLNCKYIQLQKKVINILEAYYINNYSKMLARCNKIT